MTPPATGTIWAALPAPAFMIGQATAMECVADCNPAAEQFLSLSRRAVLGRPLAQLLQVDAEIDRALERCRANRAPVFINDANVKIGTRKPVLCSIQLALMGDRRDLVLMLVTPREIAGKLGQADGIRNAARSAIGMSQMLAHEIKNPLAGITGAAQLLSMGLDPRDRDLTDLIVAETQRIVNLLDQVEQFGNQRPPACRAINIHDVLERARRSAEVGFRRAYAHRDAYDPSCRRSGPMATSCCRFSEPVEKCRAGAARRGHDPDPHVFRAIAARARRRMGAMSRCPSMSRSSMTAPACRPRSPTRCSTRSCRAARTAPGWGWRWCRRSSPRMTAGWRSKAAPAARCFAFPCRAPRTRGRARTTRGAFLMDGTVLVADDDRTIRTVLTQALTRAGCKVHATSSLTTLMRWVEEGRGDLVITDVMMPDGNGIEMIPKISQERPDLPVIVISAQNTIMTAIQANEVDAHDYLPKPFDLPDLLKRAGAAMKNRKLVAASAQAGPRAQTRRRAATCPAWKGCRWSGARRSCRSCIA